MADAVSICNLALSFIGDSASVASIDPPDETVQAQMCATLYPIAVSTLLETFDWSFATKLASLVPYSDVDTHGWANAYALPSDCKRAIRIRPKEAEHMTSYNNPNALSYWRMPSAGRFPIDNGEPFEIAVLGSRMAVFTDATDPVLCYITSNANPAYFTGAFTMALAWQMAYLLAGQRIKGREGYNIAKNLLSQYQYSLNEAKRLDASQQNKGLLFIPRQLEVR